MAKKISKPRVPRSRAGGEWTEARYWGFIRSGLRQMSMRWPPVARLALNRARRPYKGDNVRQKWEYQCSRCTGWFARKHVEVEHVIDCGPLRSIDDIAPFVVRLFTEEPGLCVSCKSCHKIHHSRSKE